MKERQCPTCGRQVERTTGEYQYLESGLSNVRLGGVELYLCECGEHIVSIPRAPELHQIIAAFLLRKKAQLSGREIRFLRKQLGLKAKEFATLMGVDNVTVSRWERGENAPSESNDRLIRLLYASRMEWGKIAAELASEIFPEIKPEQEEYPIFLPVDQLSSLPG